MLGGLCFICLNRTGPGEIICSLPGYLALGEFAGPPTARVRDLAARFEAAGVKTVVAPDLQEARWQKLVWNVPFNGLVITAGGVTTDVIMGEANLRAEVHALMDEIAAAAARLGHAVPPGFIQMQLDHTAAMGPYRPSSLVDWQEGRAVEVEAIWGEPLRRAQAAGAAMPHLAKLYADLKRLTARQAG